MSVATPTSTCKHCGNDYSNGVQRGFCSRHCVTAHKGEKLLEAIRHSHVLCSVCFAQLKSIEEPTDETKRKVQGLHSTESLVGYQYLTPIATQGQYGTECICGNIDADGMQEIRELHDFVHNLKRAVDFLRERSKTEKEFNVEVFREAYDSDLAYAVGVALE